MNRWITAVSDVASRGLKDGEQMRLFIAMFLGVFLVALIWSLISDRPAPPS